MPSALHHVGNPVGNSEGDGMARHITKRYNTWFAVLDIPAGVRPYFGGRRRFFKTLETESETDALERAPFLVAKWKGEIAKARGGGGAMDTFEATAAWYRQQVLEIRAEHADDEDDEAEQTVLGVLIDSLEGMERKHPGKGVEVWKRATGETVGTAEHLDEFLAKAGDTPKGKDMKRVDLLRLARQFPTTSDITRKEVLRWCDRLTNDDSLKRTTVVRLLSSCRGYWEHLQRAEVVAEGLEPFNNLRLPKDKNGRNKANEPQPYAPEEVVHLLRAAEDKGDQQLADLIRLGMYTGALLVVELTVVRVTAVAPAGSP